MHNDSYHMVTRVNEAAGDNPRRSLVGFFFEKNPITERENADLKSLALSGEVIEEATGKSSLFVPGVRVGFDPQPDPPSPN